MASGSHTVIEKQETRSWTTSDGKQQATRTYVVWDETSPFTTTFQIRERFGLTPASGSPLPSLGDEMIDDPDLFATDVSIDRIEGTDIWQVKYTYKQGGGGGVKAPSENGYVQMTLNFQVSFKNVFRRGMAYPTNGNPTSETSNIGGTPVDVNGVPMSVPYYQTNVTISETRHGGIDMVAAQNSRIRDGRGKRNSAAFYGSAIGRLLFQGARVSRTGTNIWQFDYEFVEAQDFHLIQVPQINQLGNVQTTPVNGIERATNVFWHQPFPDGFDFNTLSENF